MEKESLYHFASKKIYNQNIVFLVFEKNILSKIVVKIVVLYINAKNNYYIYLWFLSFIYLYI